MLQFGVEIFTKKNNPTVALLLNLVHFYINVKLRKTTQIGLEKSRDVEIVLTALLKKKKV